MRLIDADALIHRICEERDGVKIEHACDIGYHNGLNMAASMAINAPTIEARPVVRGEWIEYDCFCCNSNGEPVVKTGSVFVCSVCGREERYREPFCNCGADMGGVDDGKT